MTTLPLGGVSTYRAAFAGLVIGLRFQSAALTDANTFSGRLTVRPRAGVRRHTLNLKQHPAARSPRCSQARSNLPLPPVPPARPCGDRSGLTIYSGFSRGAIIELLSLGWPFERCDPRLPPRVQISTGSTGSWRSPGTRALRSARRVNLRRARWNTRRRPVPRRPAFTTPAEVSSGPRSSWRAARHALHDVGILSLFGLSGAFPVRSPYPGSSCPSC